MRAIIRNIHIITCLIFCLSCNNRRSQEIKGIEKNLSPVKKAPGKIVFVKEIHNFGTLKDGETVSFSFVFQNAGGSPFNLTKGEKSCGCVDIKYGTNMINPGESSVVEVVFNTAGEWGNVIKGVTVETSEGERKELQIGAYIENKQFNLLNIQK